jgi:hypothetical protein
MPHMARVRTRPNDLCSGDRLSACRDLAIELRWPGDHERHSRPGACNGETMRAIAWHEDKAARGNGPPIAADVAVALTVAWDAFGLAAGDDAAGWDTASASAEARPEMPLSDLVAGHGLQTPESF